MSRPQFITQEQIDRWNINIDQDPNLPTVIKNVADMSLIREVAYASLWLAEQLQQARCNDILITRIQYTMGSLSFGHDPWEVAQEMWTAYQNNDLDFEIDYDTKSVI